MIRTILSIAILSALVTASVQADPKTSKKSASKKNTQTTASKTDATASGWSYTNGVWTHVDGYKLVNGQVLRSGIQTHKSAPKPPTKAEMDAAMKKLNAPKTAAQLAAEKSAQHERNLAPKPAPQTGSHF